MGRWRAALGLSIVCLLFVILNRPAFHGYFQDDELDTLSWASRLAPAVYLKAAITPKFLPDNFRPVGHLFFYAERWFHLDFAKYLAVLQAIHLFNFWLLWMIVRKTGAPFAAALLGCLFFAFHMALFDAFWKPMYVYDVLCGTFCLLSLLFWTYRRWVLSFAAFWLAYKAKELAVMLPAVLACYEIWLGEKRWKPLIPFFAASLSFGLQGLIQNPNQNNDYTFRFTRAALRKTSTYYAGRVFLIPYLGFLVPLAGLFSRQRRTWFGLAMSGILFFPLLFLPGRIFSAYCYVPFAGLALAISGIAETAGPILVAVLLILMAPLNLHELRARRNVTLAHDDDVRGWVAPVRSFARAAPPLDAVVWHGRIPHFGDWGEEGAIRVIFHDPNMRIVNTDDPAALDLLRHARVAYIVWNPALRRSTVAAHGPGISDLAYVDLAKDDPFWQMEQGWFDPEAGYRWTAPSAVARLARPAGATRFVMRVLVGPDRLQAKGPAMLRVHLDGRELDPRRLTAPGWQTLEWRVEALPAGTARMELGVDPPFRPAENGNTLGIAVGSFGFVSADWRPSP